jgi:hypothetical protein
MTEIGSADFTLVRSWRGTASKAFGLEPAVAGFALLVVLDVAVIGGLGAAGKLGGAWPLVVAVAIATYMSLASVLNRTTVSTRDHEMWVRHGPVPWSRSRRVPIAEIARIEVRTPGGARWCGVYANLRIGKRVPVVGYATGFLIVTADEAKFIGQQLERRLGLDRLPQS